MNPIGDVTQEAVGYRILVSVALGLGVLALAGCTPPQDDPTKSPTPTPTATPLPESATFRSENGAMSFAAYYYSLVDYGQQTHDWAPLKRLSLPECTECAALWEPDSRIFDPGKTDANDPSIQLEGNSAHVDVRLTGAPDPASPDARPPHWVDELHLVYANGAWKVEEIEVKQ